MELTLWQTSMPLLKLCLFSESYTNKTLVCQGKTERCLVCYIWKRDNVSLLIKPSTALWMMVTSIVYWKGKNKKRIKSRNLALDKKSLWGTVSGIQQRVRKAIFFLYIFYSSFYICIYFSSSFTCIDVLTPYMSVRVGAWCLQRPEEDLRPHGTGVTNVCKPLCECR